MNLRWHVHCSIKKYNYNNYNLIIMHERPQGGGGGAEQQWVCARSPPPTPLKNYKQILLYYIWALWPIYGLFVTFSPCEGLFATFFPTHGGPFSSCRAPSLHFFPCGGSFLSLCWAVLGACPPPFRNFCGSPCKNVS